MKKVFILLMAIGFSITSCNNNKNDKVKNNREKDDYGKTENNTGDENTSNKGWSENDKNSALKECIASFEEKDVDLANKICPCVLGKLEKEYPTYSEAEKKGGEAAVEKMAFQCKEEIVGNTGTTNVSSGWPQAERESFVSNCVSTAMAGGKSRLVSQNYCECMLTKMERIFPDVQELSKLTDEDLASPEMKKMASDCLKEN